MAWCLFFSSFFLSFFLSLFFVMRKAVWFADGVLLSREGGYRRFRGLSALCSGLL
ncbi:hypothetical protein L209DRAFT_750268 [Thermothelomyces heterothallicus CBS 203.75]